MDKYDEKADVMAHRIGSFLVGESVNDVVRLTPSVAKNIAQALRESAAEAFEEVRYYCKGSASEWAGVMDEFVTRKIVLLGGTFDDQRKYARLRKRGGS